MKKFIITVCIMVLLFCTWNISYYRLGLYIDLHPDEPVTTFVKTDPEQIYMEQNGTYKPFEIRGVNMGVGIPGKWATDYAIDTETYLRWFTEIQDMGANTIRVYTILQDDFYKAFYQYNTLREEEGKEPLWLIHGVWVNDYVQNSHRDAYDDDFRQALLDDSKTVIDILHGKKNLNLGYGTGSGHYRKDVSSWVIGYILGVEWEDVTVAYTDHKYPDRNSYQGNYLYTTEDASPFEAMLCEVGDKVIGYESKRYKQQKLLAFSNWPTTDPFDYPAHITYFFMKCARVDAEHIKTTDSFQSGCFASYHVYPYYPDYLNYTYSDLKFIHEPGVKDDFLQILNPVSDPVNPIENYLKDSDYKDSHGRVNSYYTYLKVLNDYHTLPVVISEYGVSTGRSMAHRDRNTSRNQGNMSEDEQGEAIIECYQDIRDAGCAGSCVFTWQDEWFKRTWNTMHAVDLLNTPYWSDYQTNEQYFGLLSFDPGKEESVCYADGDFSEWTEEDLVLSDQNLSLSMKYDEKFLYFLIRKDGFSPYRDVFYLPVDITPKTGSTYCKNLDISFENASDFVMIIDGRRNSRILVQERYEVLRAMYAQKTINLDPYLNIPDPDTPVFKPIHLILETATPLLTRNWEASAETYETGLLTYGNANPEAADFNSLADFIFAEDGVEIKIPWQLFNFSNPSEMMVHDDYYEKYGVENIHIDEMYIGLSEAADTKGRIRMEAVPLKGWGKHVTYHERLKESYYILKDYWASH